MFKDNEPFEKFPFITTKKELITIKLISWIKWQEIAIVRHKI